MHASSPLLCSPLLCSALLSGSWRYLTVHESVVQRGETQRRPGAHIESPEDYAVGRGGRWFRQSESPGRQVRRW